MKTSITNPYLTIALNAHKFERIESFLNYLRDSCSNPESFEVAIAIGMENLELMSQLEEISHSLPFKIIVRRTPYDYLTANHNANELLFNGSTRSTYFYMHVSDRFRFSRDGWDLILKDYFFIPGLNSTYILTTNTVKVKKFTLADCWKYPDNWSIYTRKYLETVGGFSIHQFCHDCADEMLRFFVRNNKRDKLERHVPIPYSILNDSKVLITKDSPDLFRRYIIGALYYNRMYFSKKSLDTLREMSSRITNEKKKNKVSWIFWLNQNFWARKQRRGGMGFILTFFPILKSRVGYNFLRTLLVKKYRYNHLPSKIILYLSSVIFITENPHRDLSVLLRKHSFKTFMSSKDSLDAYLSGFGKVSVDEIAREQEMRYKIKRSWI